jgi:hypothetical protein
VASLDGVLRALADTLAAAEAAQATTGGANPRFGPLFDEAPVHEPVDGAAPDEPPAGGAPSSPGSDTAHRPRSAAVVTDRPALGAAVARRLEAGGCPSRVVDASRLRSGFDASRTALGDVAADLGGVDVVVVALATPSGPAGGPAWQDVLAGHAGLVDQLHVDAGWARAVADHAAAADHPLRLVSVVDAASPGGRSRAQAVAQLARASRQATGDRVAAFAVALEAADEEMAAASLVGHLAAHPGAAALAGAELVVGAGWLGLRSHPRPAGSITFGGPALPPWFAGALAEMAGAHLSPEEGA